VVDQEFSQLEAHLGPGHPENHVPVMLEFGVAGSRALQLPPRLGFPVLAVHVFGCVGVRGVGRVTVEAAIQEVRRQALGRFHRRSCRAALRGEGAGSAQLLQHAVVAIGEEESLELPASDDLGML
jgi:hypothetical protein